eukprot:15327917-Ditylum_brightwellii.AAC.1
MGYFESFPSEYLQENKNKYYIKGIVGCLILTGIFLAKDLKLYQKKHKIDVMINDVFKLTGADDNGDPFGSDFELDSNNKYLEYSHIVNNTARETEDANGVLWGKDIDIPEPKDQEMMSKEANKISGNK